MMKRGLLRCVILGLGCLYIPTAHAQKNAGKMLLNLTKTPQVSAPALSKQVNQIVLNQLKAGGVMERSVVSVPQTRDENNFFLLAATQREARGIQLKKTSAILPDNPTFELRHPFVQSTFQARAMSSMPRLNTYSGTVFQVDYEGTPEVYGVVSAHTIADEEDLLMLGRYFFADVYVDGKFVSVSAEVVQMGSMSLLDVALIKFHPDDEKLFKPLHLAANLPQVGEKLQSYGYIETQELAEIEGREVLVSQPKMLRTSLAWPRVHRPGLCGSAVVNQRHELVGIHVGSSYTGKTEQQDIGYVLPASWLNTLVNAYHTQGALGWGFELNGEVVADLRVDEYISQIKFLDDQGNVLWSKRIDTKFPYSQVQQQLDALKPQRLVLQIGKTEWKNGNKFLFIVPAQRRVIYDLKLHRPIE